MVLKTKDYKSNEIFKFIRENSELTQEQLAKKAKIGKSSIEKYEYGITSFKYKTLLNVVNVCNLNIIIYNNRTKIYANNYTPKDLLKIIRATRKLTQKEFAKLTGISESSIKKYESGCTNYSFEVLIQITNAFDLEIMITDK